MDEMTLKKIVEALLMVAGEPLSIDRLLGAFAQQQRPKPEEIRTILQSLAEDYQERSIVLKEVASGYYFQVRQVYAPWVTQLLQARSQRLSRALLETLAIIAYEQPITRAEIEDIRGVSLHSNILKNLLDCSWIRIAGRRNTPGRPATYVTTKAFLDHLNLKSLSELPALIKPDEAQNVTSVTQAEPVVPENCVTVPK